MLGSVSGILHAKTKITSDVAKHTFSIYNVPPSSVSNFANRFANGVSISATAINQLDEKKIANDFTKRYQYLKDNGETSITVHASEDFQQIDDRNRLGSGTYSKVYAIKSKDGHSEYAVKMFRFDHEQYIKMIAAVLLEASRLIDFSQEKHIVECRGIFETNGKLGILLDKMPDSLYNRLYDKKYKQSLTLKDRLAIACNLLKGVDAIHKQGLFHGDLKSKNILIGQEVKEVKIAGLRLCSFVNSKYF